VERRLRLLGSHLPDLEETGWLMFQDADGLFHDSHCVHAASTSLREQRLRALLAGEHCCPQCTSHTLSDRGSVGGLLLRLTEPLAAHLVQPTKESALALLLRGQNRALPRTHFSAFRRQHLLPLLTAGRDRGRLCVLTAGDFRDEVYAPETVLGPLLGVVADGFLAQSERGALTLYVVGAANPSVRGHPRILETDWEGGHADTIEAFFMFGEDALSGAIDWRDPAQWWETSKIL